jgi:hypothetical protein
MEKISWIFRVRNEGVLHRVNRKGNIVQIISRKRANWIGHILFRNCLLKRVIEEKIEGRIDVTGRRGIRCKQLLDDLKGKERILEIKTRDTRSQPVENWLGRSLRSFPKTD